MPPYVLNNLIEMDLQPALLVRNYVNRKMTSHCAQTTMITTFADAQEGSTAVPL